jgi:hypothetical protein
LGGLERDLRDPREGASDPRDDTIDTCEIRDWWRSEW